jgi:hypothetical protein
MIRQVLGQGYLGRLSRSNREITGSTSALKQVTEVGTDSIWLAQNSMLGY